MRTTRLLLVGLVAVLCCGGRAAAAPPTDPAAPDVPADTAAPTTTLAPGELPPALGPLVPIPVGCAAPAAARAVFVGRLMTTDQPPTTARFRIERMLAGDLDGYSSGNLVDVHYGDETHFLTPGTRYIVGAGVDATTGLLTSTVRAAAPLFGGDAVIGADDSDVQCPRVDDPVRTLEIDGTSVDTGVLTPLQGEGASLLSAFLRPLGVALLVLVLLVLVKHLLFAVGRSLRDIGRAEPRPPRQPPSRQHRPISGAVDQAGP